MEPANTNLSGSHKNTAGHPITIDDGFVVETDTFVDLKPLKYDKEGAISSGNAGPIAESYIESNSLTPASVPEKKSGGNS